MLLTLLSAGIALAGGLMLLAFGTRFAAFPSFAPTLGVMLGLGVGIDYALLIVGRYREQLAAGDDVREAARVANSTAGTSVVAAGATVPATGESRRPRECSSGMETTTSVIASTIARTARVDSTTTTGSRDRAGYPCPLAMSLGASLMPALYERD